LKLIAGYLPIAGDTTGTRKPGAREPVRTSLGVPFETGSFDAYAEPAYAVGTNQMKFVRSDTPEVARSIASASVRVSRYWPAFRYALPFDLIILLLFIVMSLLVSVRSAAWLGMFFFLTWNAYVFWLTKLSRRNWVMAVCAGRAYVRLYMTREEVPSGIDEPDVIVFDASEIASISIRTVEAYLYGPKPKFAECLVIEPAPSVAGSVPTNNPSFPRYCETLGCCGESRSNYLVHVANEDGRLVVAWRRCHPDVRVFVREIVREFPFVFVGPEERCEIDLNSIWHGYRSMNLDEQQRHSLLQAKCFGFGPDCAWLLTTHKDVSSPEVQACLAELEREEAGTGR
jgi:hypothetical protein